MTTVLSNPITLKTQPPKDVPSTSPPTFLQTHYAPSINLPAPYPPNTTFPLALTPSTTQSTPSDLITAIQTLTSTSTIRLLLTQHSAIYFTNLSLPTATDFSVFAKSFGWKPHEDIGNPVRRTLYAPNVATANEGPNTQPIYPHNEFGLSPHYPAYVFFYCLEEPEEGGETPINSSIVLYDVLKKAVPEFLEEVERKGVQYQLFYPNTPREDTTSGGTSVLQSYGLHVLPSDSTSTAREKVETEIKRLATAHWQWENQSPENELGDLRVFQTLPATRIHEQTGKPAFFNNVVSRFLNAIDAGSLEAPYLNRKGQLQPPAFYGDGTEIPKHYLELAVKSIYETRALVKWKKGDVLLLDNHAVQHARETWTGPRKLLASLWDEPKV